MSEFESLLAGPSPAVLQTYRREGSALVTRCLSSAPRTWDLSATLPSSQG